MYPKPKREPFALWLGAPQQGDDRAHGAAGHRLAAGLATVARARGMDQDPEGPRRRTRPRPEGDRDRAAILGDDRKTPEEAERRYMASGLVHHRKSLAYTGRDLSKQIVANLVGSPDLIREKVAGLKAIGVDHACAPDDPGRFDGRVRRSSGMVRPRRSSHEAARLAHRPRHRARDKSRGGESGAPRLDRARQGRVARLASVRAGFAENGFGRRDGTMSSKSFRPTATISAFPL